MTCSCPRSWVRRAGMSSTWFSGGAQQDDHGPLHLLTVNGQRALTAQVEVAQHERRAAFGPLPDVRYGGSGHPVGGPGIEAQPGLQLFPVRRVPPLCLIGCLLYTSAAADE